jgi:hypothetical protein
MVVPLLGPSTPRDAVGGMIGVGVPGPGVLFAVNGRAQADEQIETAKRDACVQSDGAGNWWDDSPIGAALSEELYEGTTETDLEVTVDPGPASSSAIEARHREARRQRESRAEEPQLRRRAQCAASTRSQPPGDDHGDDHRAGARVAELNAYLDPVANPGPLDGAGSPSAGSSGRSGTRNSLLRPSAGRHCSPGR